MTTKERKHLAGYGVQLKLEGLSKEPIMSVEFLGLPSINAHYGKHWRQRSPVNAEWRYEARTKAYDYTLFRDDDDYLVDRALVVVNVFPSVEEVMDIHNVYIKPVLDGFSDAGVWADDEFSFVPIVMYRWAGKGEHKPREQRIRKTVIDVYELHSLWVSGIQQTLPAGRKRL